MPSQPTIASRHPRRGHRERECLRGDVGCVEVAFAGDVIAVRDSKAPDQAVLAFTPHEWDVFVRGVKNGEFDRQ